MDRYQTWNGRSQLTQTFESAGPYAYEKALEACDDVLNIDDDDALEAHHPDRLFHTQYSLTDPLESFQHYSASGDDRDDGLLLQLDSSPHIPDATLDINQQPPPWIPLDYRASEPGSGANDMHGATALPASARSVVANAVGFDTIEPRVYSSYHEPDMAHSNALCPSEMIPDSAASQALSADLARSCHSLNQEPDMLFNFGMESQNESLPEATQQFVLDDGVGVNANPQAGIAMDLMEGFDDGLPAKSRIGIRNQADDPILLSAEDFSYTTHPNNERAFVGGLFSTSSGARSGLAYDQNASEWVTQNPAYQLRSDRHETGISESFPTTQHKFPQGLRPACDLDQSRSAAFYRQAPQGMGTPRHRAISSPQPLSQDQKDRVLKAGRRRSTASSVKIDRRRLGPIAETSLRNDESLVKSKSAGQPMQRVPSRAKRSGPLSDEKKAKAADMRKSQATCLPCKVQKISCDGKDPCDRCSKSRNERCCVPSNWWQHVASASCDNLFHLLVFQPALYPSVDAVVALPSQIDPGELLKFALCYKADYDLAVQHVTGANYTIDLGIAFALLSRRTSPFRLSDLLTSESSAIEWLDVLRYPDTNMTIIQRLWEWGAMPSRATYQLVAKQVGNPPIAIVNIDRLRSAAIISRISLRANEYLGHKALQDECNKIAPTTMDALDLGELKGIARHTGKIACLVRLKLAYCEQPELQVFSTFSSNESTDRNHKRMKEVVKGLYFWHIAAATKLKKKDKTFELEDNSLVLFTRSVADPFPKLGTMEGFQRWLVYGHTVLREADFDIKPSGQQNLLDPASYISTSYLNDDQLLSIF